MKAIQETDRNVIGVSIILAVVVWLSLVFLVMNLPPVGINVFLFFLALFLAVLHTLAPLLWAVNRRWASNPQSSTIAWRSLRQAGALALFATLCAWLQMLNNLNWLTALLILGILVAMEALLEIKR